VLGRQLAGPGAGVDLVQSACASLGLRDDLVGDRDDVAAGQVVREGGGDQGGEIVPGADLADAVERDRGE
jgi:hypothetical protein